MAKSLTYRDIIEKTLRKVGKPLSANEIWQKADELGVLEGYVTEGKTPWATIAAFCYTNINKEGENSLVVQTSTRPAKFFLRHGDGSGSQDVFSASLVNQSTTLEKSHSQKDQILERDLHPVLASFVYGHPHFRASLKTLFHEKSIKAAKGKNEWLHPDVVGVYFPFAVYSDATREAQKYLSVTSIKLYSFELKLSLSFSNLRQSYFQAVSNSSWAHEGYLVAKEIDQDQSFIDELRRLNNAFGIGVIRLNIDTFAESEILLPAKNRQEIDWDTVDRLAQENSDFKIFLDNISEDCKLGKVKSIYDSLLDESTWKARVASKKV